MIDRKNKIIQLINDAFDESSPPHIDEITSHRCDECDELRNFLAGKHWKDISPDPGFQNSRCREEYLGWHRDGLCLLSNEAFHHYLPLWAIACVQYPREIDSGYDSLLFGLKSERLVCFSLDELRALKSLVEYLTEEAINAGETEDFLRDEREVIDTLQHCIADRSKTNT